MREKSKRLLGELLIEDGVLTREHLQAALAEQKSSGGLIGQILITKGFISEENLVSALGRQLGMPYLPLQNYSVNQETVTSFDEEFCRKNLFLPFDEDDKRLYVTTSDPLNENVFKELERRGISKIHLYLSTTTEILNTINLIFTIHAKKKEVKKAG